MQSIWTYESFILYKGLSEYKSGLPNVLRIYISADTWLNQVIRTKFILAANFLNVILALSSNRHRSIRCLAERVHESEIRHHLPKFTPPTKSLPGIQTDWLWLKAFCIVWCSTFFLQNITEICPVILTKKLFLCFSSYIGMKAILNVETWHF